MCAVSFSFYQNFKLMPHTEMLISTKIMLWMKTQFYQYHLAFWGIRELNMASDVIAIKQE